MSPWTELFRGKSAKTRPDPRLRWFGKLPTYADYYGGDADTEWAAEFSDWVLKGYALYDEKRRSEPKGPHRLQNSRCVIRMPRSGMVVLASVQDYGGDMRGRPFPLFFYVGYPSKPWPGPASGHWPAVCKVFRALDVRHDLVPHFCNSPARIEQVFGGQEIDLSGLDGEKTDIAWVKEAAGMSMVKWLSESGVGAVGDVIHGWLQATSECGDKIARLDDADFEVTLCFPVSDTLSLEAQGAGWLRWLETRMDLRERYLSLIVTGEPGRGPGRFSIIARKSITEQDFLLLTPLARTLGYVDDLSIARPPEEMGDDGQREETARVSAGLPETWADFVGARGYSP